VTREELDGIVGLWVDGRTETRPAGGGSVVEMPLAHPLAAAGIHLPIAALI
jgi:hypothetical protein